MPGIDVVTSPPCLGRMAGTTFDRDAARSATAEEGFEALLDKDEEGPERTCIVTRRKASPDELVRFVVGPDGQVVPDIRGRLPGRGVWVSAEWSQVAEAVRKQAFSRGFKAKVKAEVTLPKLVDELLARDALQSLAMANKAGAVTAGFNKVEGALSEGSVLCLLHAADGSADGIRKLDAAARRGAAGRPPPPSINVFPSRDLDLALGRTNVIHAALAVGPASYAFLTRCRRLTGYRPAASPDQNAGADAATA